MHPVSRRPARLLALGLALLGCGSSEGRDTSALRAVLRQDAALGLDRMTGQEVDTLVRLLTRIATPCDSIRTLADELTDPASSCPRARGAARFTARRLMEGYGADEVESQVVRRYRETEPVAIDLEGSEPLGPEDAPVTIVVFSDFECPHCRRASEILLRLQRENPARIRIYYKHFPLDSHPMAMSAARACVAARDQGKYWEFHEQLYENQDEIGPGLYVRIATGLGMDLDRFEAERISQESATRVQRDKLEGQRIGVEATPTIFVNGRRFQDSIEALDEWIEEE